MQDPYAGTGLSSYTIQPAVLAGTRPSGSTGTYLVDYSRDSGYSGPPNADEVRVFRLDNPLGSPTFTLSRFNIGNVDAAPNPATQPLTQPGTPALLDGGDERSYNAFWRNDTLVFTNTVTPPFGPDAGQPTVNLVTLSTTGGTPTVVGRQDIGANDLGAGTTTTYGTVAIDANGTIGVGFTASGPAVFAGAYFTTVDPTTGAVAASDLLVAGVGPYTSGSPLGGTTSLRWGDYSATVLDPTDETFWVFNQYAAGGSKFAPWGTFAGHFTTTRSLVATGTGVGGGPDVKVYTPSGKLLQEFMAYDPASAAVCGWPSGT